MADNQKEPVAEQMLNTDDATAIPWADVREGLTISNAGTYWLATVRPDGRPHVVPVGAVWLDNSLYFTTGQGTQKEKNIQHNPHCVITLASGGFDLVFEGEAAKVKDEEKLQRLADIYSSPENGWPVTVRDGLFDAPFSAPTTGPAPYEVYEVTLAVAFAFGTTEETATHPTRYRF